MNTSVINAVSDEHILIVKQLFIEYAQWLGFDLCFQGFESELASLPGKYSPPDGRLYLAMADHTAVGCAGLRKIADGECEMKRLYLRPESRGLGLGKMLIEQMINDALAIGYKKMLLDTYPPKMGQAVNLYREYGFTETEPYYDNPHKDDGVLFMELDLTKLKS